MITNIFLVGVVHYNFIPNKMYHMFYYKICDTQIYKSTFILATSLLPVHNTGTCVYESVAK